MELRPYRKQRQNCNDFPLKHAKPSLKSCLSPFVFSFYPKTDKSQKNGATIPRHWQKKTLFSLSQYKRANCQQRKIDTSKLQSCVEEIARTIDIFAMSLKLDLPYDLVKSSWQFNLWVIPNKTIKWQDECNKKNSN